MWLPPVAVVVTVTLLRTHPSVTAVSVAVCAVAPASSVSYANRPRLLLAAPLKVTDHTHALIVYVVDAANPVTSPPRGARAAWYATWASLALLLFGAVLTGLLVVVFGPLLAILGALETAGLLSP